MATAIVDRIRKAALEAVRATPENFEAAAGAMLVTLGMTEELEFLAGETLRKKAQPYLAEARGGGHVEIDAQIGNAPATPLAGADDKDHSPSDAQKTLVPSAPVPRPRQVKHHAVATQTVAKSIFDEFKVTLRQGSRVEIGDIYFAGLPSLVKQSGKRAWISDRENEIFRQILSWSRIQAHIPKGSRIRDVMDVKTLEAFIEGAAMSADIKAKLTYRPEQANA